jgi:hypothetical protein
MWQVGLVKFLAGLATTVIPVVLTVLGFYVWRQIFNVFGVYYRRRVFEGEGGFFQSGNWYFDVAIFCTSIAASFYIWSAAMGVNRKDEISAGAVALAGIVGWIAILTMVSRVFLTDSYPGDSVARWVSVLTVSLAPGGVALLTGPHLTPAQLTIAIWIMALVHVLLATLYVRRFGEVAEREVTSPQVARRDPRRHDWLAPPRRSALTAIAWKQFRESGPIAALGLTGIVAITLLLYSMPESGKLFDVYTGVSIVLGFCLALVIGIGVALHDLSSPLNEFWRTRPINPNLWFWLKFVAGLGIVAITIYVPLFLIAALYPALQHDPEAIAIIPAFHIATFAAAVAMTCFLRHAVYAAILTIAVMQLSIVATWLVWILLGRFGWTQLPDNWLELLEETPIIVSGLMICLVVSTIAAWLMVRYDLGRKSRY